MIVHATPLRSTERVVPCCGVALAMLGPTAYVSNDPKEVTCGRVDVDRLFADMDELGELADSIAIRLRKLTEDDKVRLAEYLGQLPIAELADLAVKRTIERLTRM